MSEPPRLLSSSDTSPFARDVLDSWATEQPSGSARERALSIAGGAVAATVMATTVASVTPKTAAAALGTAALTKWAIFGAVLLAGAGITFAFVARSERRASAVSTATAMPTAMRSPPAAATGPTTSASTGPPTVSLADSPTAGPEPGLVATAHAHAAPAAPVAERAASLTEEIGLFDRARAALDAGDADRALGLLDEYENRFRAGAFLQEAQVLRVQALARKGERAAASRVAERFLAAHPGSPHEPRLRAILRASSP